LVRSNINRGRQRREELRKRAEELAQSRASRSASQQLSLLDDRLGVGVGAVQERARLQQEIDEAKSEKRDRQKPKEVDKSARKKGERKKAKERRTSRAGRRHEK